MRKLLLMGKDHFLQRTSKDLLCSWSTAIAYHGRLKIKLKRKQVILTFFSFKWILAYCTRAEHYIGHESILNILFIVSPVVKCANAPVQYVLLLAVKSVIGSTPG